VVYEQIVPFL